MTMKELRQLSVKEREQLLQGSREKLRGLRFKTARRELKDVRDVRETRKIIAQLLTLAKQEYKK